MRQKLRKDKMIIRKQPTRITSTIKKKLQAFLNDRLVEYLSDTVEEKENALKSNVYKVCKQKPGIGSTETAWSWRSLLTAGTLPGITRSASTPSLLRLNIKHAVNFFDRDAESSKINGDWQKCLNSRYLQTLKIPKSLTKVWEWCGG